MGPQALDEERAELWRRVEELWKLSLTGDPATVRTTLHPDYTGWVTGQPAPHDREAAIRSVGPDSPRVLDYKLMPLAVRVFDGRVGVAHYSYEAQVGTPGGDRRPINGRWSEVYVRHEGEWVMISVSGGPDGQR